MHVLKNYVQAAVWRTSETVARGSTKKKDNGQKIQKFRTRQALSRTREKRGLDKKKREYQVY